MSASQAPRLEIDAVKDPTGGFNVQIITSRFRWSPEHVSGAFVPGEGHAHLYLDGIKIGRVYGSWFHVNAAQFASRAGEQLVSVELVGNDHAPYAALGVPIRSEVLINVPQAEVLMRGQAAQAVSSGELQSQVPNATKSWGWGWLIGLPVALGIGLILGTALGRRGTRAR